MKSRKKKGKKWKKILYKQKEESAKMGRRITLREVEKQKKVE